eukprot:TRINITY_DN747_c0_g3_i3.p1 TRINITY_DN747_c0_g3~~TRINITY_DN747_c0_g3_i3.p1  ORF type:complete len:181 (-),score=21.35 TRINITY_DN747_c0_g3_i3:561-1103(-)
MTNQGNIRRYNEDEFNATIPMKISSEKPGRMPTTGFFAIYDGHGGGSCSKFLARDLPNMVVRDRAFPERPDQALLYGIQSAENYYLDCVRQGTAERTAGSCAIILLTVNDACYVANVGDSRALLSSEGGTRVIPLSVDHKPELKEEKERILRSGGEVNSTRQDPNIFRVFPPGLSVLFGF